MKKFTYKLWSKFLVEFGNVKYYKWPLWLLYDPSDYRVTGQKVLQILDILQPGDIILRGYDHYLDGLFIPDELKYSHGAIYVGNNKIVHAVAKGVSETDVVDFCRCDRIAILRPVSEDVNAALSRAQKFLEEKVPYDFGFKNDVSALYCFELCGKCYEEVNVQRYTVKKLFGLLKKKHVYLAKSFLSSPDFKCVFHFNPKFNIDFSAS